MDKLINLIDSITDDILKVVISSPFYKTNEYKKIVIEKKDGYFLVSKYFDTKVIHENIKDDFSNSIYEKMNGYKNINIFTTTEDITVLTNKKGNVTIKKTPSKNTVKTFSTHNREKNYIINEGDKVDFLIHLGVMDKNGNVYNSYKKKFKQINKFLELLKDIEENISTNSTILDVGCGKSYLTFSIYYYFNVIKNMNVNIIGIDLKKDVIDTCNDIKNSLGYENLTFYNMDIKDYKNETPLDLVVSLHACDIATDYSIYTAIRLGAKSVLCVPCCQHELFTMITSDVLSPLLSHGILKERFSAILTDTIRAELLEQNGYSAKIMEFIQIDDTPKNLAIKAIYTGKKKSDADFLKLKNEFNANLTLEKLLKDL